jgi:hypothetical protein
MQARIDVMRGVVYLAASVFGYTEIPFRTHVKNKAKRKVTQYPAVMHKAGFTRFISISVMLALLLSPLRDRLRLFWRRRTTGCRQTHEDLEVV